jgi:hypothetical protein
MATITKSLGASIVFGLILNFVSHTSSLQSKKDDLFQRIDELVIDESTTSKKKLKQVSINKSIENPVEPIQEEFALKKNKNGDLLVSWELLSEYDLSKSKASSNLSKIIGKKISIKGFMVPLDYSAKQIKEFLLIPYMPSCAHVPPPSANTIINVRFNGSKKLSPSYYPIEINGILNVSEPSGKSNPYLPEGIYSILATSISEIDE